MWFPSKNLRSSIDIFSVLKSESLKLDVVLKDDQPSWNRFAQQLVWNEREQNEFFACRTYGIDSRRGWA